MDEELPLIIDDTELGYFEGTADELAERIKIAMHAHEDEGSPMPVKQRETGVGEE